MILTRRQMIISLLGVSAAGMLPGRRGFAQKGGAAASLAPDEMRCLTAAADRILPGAAAAGFADYLAYWIEREPFRSAVDFRPLLKVGAVHLDRVANQTQGHSFADLGATEQDALLRQFQEGKIAAKGFPAPAFFQRLTMLTLESFFSEPRYGGNRGEVGWTFIGRHPCWWSPKRVRRALDPGRAMQD